MIYETLKWIMEINFAAKIHGQQKISGFTV